MGFGVAADWAKFAHGMVSIWLTPLNGYDVRAVLVEKMKRRP